MDYGFTHEGRVFTPNGTTGISPAENDARNRALTAAELEHWRTNPDRMRAYYKFPLGLRPAIRYRGECYPYLTDASVTTWTGEHLGTITAARVYQHNFGGRFVSVRVRSITGAEYHGRASWDWGNCILLRRCK